MSTLKITAKNPEDNREQSEVHTLLFHQGKLYSGAEDGKIKIWNQDLTYVGEIVAHENCYVYCLAAIGSTIYSCSNDCTIKAWDVNTKTLKKLLYSGHSDIGKLYADSGKLFAGNEHGRVLIFENDIMLDVQNVVEEIRDIIADGDIMYTVRGLDVTVTEIMKGNRGRFLIKNSIEGKSPICLVGGKFAACTRDGKDMTVYHADKGVLKMFCTIKGSEMIITSLAGVQLGDQTILYSGGWDKIIKRWIISGEKPLPGGCAIVPSVINVICTGPEGQAYTGGPDGLICRLDMS